MLIGKNISFVRKELSLFVDLSFVVKRGERLAIKGANGSGKSTLLRLIAGLTPLKSGTLLWKEEIVSKANLRIYQQNLLYVGHKLCLHPQARISDQLQLWKSLHKVPEKDMEQALSLWGIKAFKDKQIAHLSQGQQKRLSLSRCHWLKRSLWVLDEPEAGLDEEGRTILNEALIDHSKRGGYVVQATHSSKSAPLEIFL